MKQIEAIYSLGHRAASSNRKEVIDLMAYVELADTPLIAAIGTL
jgi:hypothetical protein